MAIKNEPASIEYTLEDGTVQILYFNAVVSEDHETKATITKYPVQEGMHVSNHSIRHNRQVVVEGVITDVQIDREDGSNTNYGLEPSKAVKEVLDSLITSGYECTVTTNLGIYTPVVFNRFKTKQKAGLMDSMLFTISGEEIIKVNTNNFTAPTPVLFKSITGAERDILAKELTTYGIYARDDECLSQGTFNKGEDFRLDELNESGTPVRTTYVYQGTNPTTGEAIYAVHFDDASVDAVANTEVAASAGFSLKGGIEQVSDCLMTEASNVATEYVEDQVDTAMGKLQKSAYGVFYDVTNMGNEYGTTLARAGVGCMVRSLTGGDDTFPYQPGESLPTTSQIMDGARSLLGIGSPSPDTVTLTKIDC
jgi:hypothetical protein